MSADNDGPSWPEIAEWYDELVEAGSGPHQTALDCLLRLVPPIEDAEVLDLACGQGLATRAIAESGARSVVGVDASAAMIELARGHDMPRIATISYVVDDAQQLNSFDVAAFDGVTCQLALMNIADLDAALMAVRRVLKPGGWFAFVIGHPCFLVPDATQVQLADGRRGVNVTGYFAERFWRSSNPDGVRRAGNYHRTLTTYLNALVRAEFVLEMVDEPVANWLLAEQQPVYQEVPIFFAARVRAS